MADLIGDIDPIKAANERRSLSDEEVIHYGILPRTHRGIFAINELPDLQTRIQVGLLNIMEERDIQIRGFPVRLAIDVCIVYTANPEDYTNRGTIITPLKDRIDSQIMTHYPQSLDDAMAITAQEAWTKRGDLCEVRIPQLLREMVEEVGFQARKSEFVDQGSGVSARVSISAQRKLERSRTSSLVCWQTGHSKPRAISASGSARAIFSATSSISLSDQRCGSDAAWSSVQFWRSSNAARCGSVSWAMRARSRLVGRRKVLPWTAMGWVEFSS